MRIYRETDIDVAPIRDRTVAIIGYGSQGRSHALNLRDSGVNVIVGAREGGPSAKCAADDRFEPMSVGKSAAQADVVMMLTSDEAMARVYADDVAPHLKAGAAVGFAHGFNIHFGYIRPAVGVAVFLAAPKGVGSAVRARYLNGEGLAGLVAGDVRKLALAYLATIGCAKLGVYETSFKEEAVTDLFGEQAVICGGITALVRAGFETLVAAGYQPELAYFECVQELKLITDLVFERGIAGMRDRISGTARYGDLTRGPRIINEAVRAEMRRVLAEIESGQFAREWLAESEAGLSRLKSLAAESESAEIEAVGRRLRGADRAGAQDNQSDGVRHKK